MGIDPNFCILISVILGVIAQILFKKGISSMGPVPFSRIHVLPSLTLRIVFQPHIFTGFLFYGIATIFWLFALSKVDLSYAFPFISLTIILTSGAGALFYGERITVCRKIGMVIVCIGILLIAQS